MSKNITFTINEKIYNGIMKKTIHDRWCIDVDDLDLMVTCNTKDQAINLMKELIIGITEEDKYE